MPIAFNQPLFLMIWLFIPLVWYMAGRSFLREHDPFRRRVTTGLRTLVILATGLTLAEPIWTQNSDQVNLFFVLDASDSVNSAGRNRGKDIIDQAIQGMGSEDQAGLILFGKKPILEVPLKRNFTSDPFHSQVNANFTNIYEAIQLAIGKLPEEGSNRIVLISDGNQNINRAENMSFLANALGIQIFSFPLDSWQNKNEVYLEKLETPAQVPLKSPFEVLITIHSGNESQGDLILLRNGKLIANHQVKLLAGDNIFRLVDSIPTAGIYSYKTVINPEEDVIYQNNEGLSFTYGTRKSGVLYLHTQTSSESPLARALEGQGFHVEKMAAGEFPGSLNDIIDHKAIILDNVHSSNFSNQDMENLEKFVKDIGGGLLMIGGDESFGAGDYRKTAIEKALPVMMDISTELVYTSLSIIFVIDKSNSMSEELLNQNKLEAAKVAAFSAIELLNPNDQVGLIAFDANYQWTVPITAAKNRKVIAEQLLSLHAEGGTKLYGGLKEAIETIKQISSVKKHVIVLSDGMIFDVEHEKNQLNALLAEASKNKITISTVAVGENADIKFMKSMAEQGKGRDYKTSDAGNIPRIFVDEIKIVARKIIFEKQMTPLIAGVTELTNGYRDILLPPIHGMDITYPKPESTVHLQTEEGPLLVTKRYGLGKSLAFTSDLAGRWGKDWLSWDQYGKFVGLLVKAVEKQETSGKYSVSVERQGGEGNFLVDVTDPNNRFVNGLDLKLNILFPDKSKSNKDLSLEQISPGKYKTTFPVEETGEYYLNLYEQQNQEFVNSQTFGYGIPYTNEFQNKEVNTTLLNNLAEKTKGRLLSSDDELATLFNVQGNNAVYGIKLWPYFLTASILLLIIDVAVRKLYEIGRFRKEND
ncbi:MAG: VWA domain-containing protein [SAR324 cluster bacterium]|nr:VWA domain-containing protein [SAR324 cluster bacterium]